MSTVGVNPPKTPVTKGSKGTAAATVPNVCKMPGPPAPFVPTPLPNIGKSDKSPKGYSTTVKIEGEFVAIKGATFGSVGDIAAKGSGGGIISANVEGATAFVSPGSMNVKIEGKSVHLLSDSTTNNHGSQANSAATALTQPPSGPPENLLPVKCSDAPAQNSVKMTECEKKQICQKCDDTNKMAKEGKLKRNTPEEQEVARSDGDRAATLFKNRLGASLKGKGAYGKKIPPVAPESIGGEFTHPCAHEEWLAQGANPKLPGLSADHVQDVQFGGAPEDPANLRMMSSKANSWIGRVFQDYDTDKHTGVKADCCD